MPFSNAKAETISYYKCTTKGTALQLPELFNMLRFSPKLSCSGILIISRVDGTTPCEPHLTDVFRVRLLDLHFSSIIEVSITIFKINEILFLIYLFLNT